MNYLCKFAPLKTIMEWKGNIFARDLFFTTLTNMGIKYEIDDGQIIWFDYQGMGFDAEEDKNGRYVTLEYIDLKSFGNIGGSH